ncbi:MAG: clan AA aspartic protease [Chitinophagaceae bacterium]|nr:MAG: clan AA aspartic protease [Chitinophagaceae bacterium]
MGIVYADITLINAGELAMGKKNIIDKDEVKQINVRMLVDSGTYMMAINETMQEQLDLSFIEKRKAVMADGSVQEYDVVGPLMVKFANRTATCNAFVLQGNNKPLLGVIPMEEMDVLIHPQRQELIVNPDHPHYAQLSMK